MSVKVLKKKEKYPQIASVKTLFGYMCSVYLLPTAPMMHERFESKIEHVNGSLMMLKQYRLIPYSKMILLITLIPWSVANA